MKSSCTNKSSFFGAQEGDFELAIKSISAFEEDKNSKPYRDDPKAITESPTNEKIANSPRKSGFCWMFNLC